MSEITVVGKITKQDNELRFTPNGHPVCNFSIAKYMGKNKDNTYKDNLFLNIVCWGDLAEPASKFKHKDRVEVKGWFDYPKGWTDKEGNQHLDIVIRAEEVTLKEWQDSKSDEDAPF